MRDIDVLILTDSEDIGKMQLGVKALATFPLKSEPNPCITGR